MNLLNDNQELIEKVRAMAGIFEYSVRERDPLGNCCYGPIPATLQEARDQMLGLLEPEEQYLWHRAIEVLGPDALYEIYVEELEAEEQRCVGKR